MDTLSTRRFCAQRTLRSACPQPLSRLAIGLVLLAGLVLFQPLSARAEELEKYSTYQLKHKSVAEAEEVLNEMLEEFGDSVRIVADVKKNRLLLSGPEKAQRIAVKVLSSLDLPVKVEAEETAEPVLKSYDCPKTRMNALVTTLRQRYSSVKGIKIAADSAGERLLVLAFPKIHEEISAELSDETPEFEEAPAPPRKVTAASTDVTPAPQPKSLPARAAKAPLPVIEADDEEVATGGAQNFQLLHVKGDVIVTSLRQLLDDRFTSVGSSKSRFRVVADEDVTADLTVDRKQNGITLAGKPELVSQISRIIRSLDAANDADNDQTLVLPIGDLDADRIQSLKKAIAVAPVSKTSRRDGAKGSKKTAQKSSVANAAFTEDRDQLSTIRLVKNQGPAAQTVDGDGGAPPMAGDAEDAPELEQQLRRLGSELELEVLPDLDAIILRGNKADIKEMTRILKELERLSVETEPKIEIYPLKHVRGESLAALIEKVNVDLTGALHGKVTVTALVKPNALLIIGWGESVKSVHELIEKLDQPVPVDSQFQVFRLKHAEAQTSRTTVQEFFTARTTSGSGTGTTSGPGLAPRVQVTADLRTNSIIVQAPPRDLEEAAELIKELDVPGGAVVHQARIFKLKNTLASDLSAILQSAIDAARGKEGAGNAPQKSALLEFLSIDKEGRQVQKSAILSDVKVTADPRTNSLLVSATPESMDLIASLIQKLDESSQEGAQIKVFRVINGDAVSLVQMLRSLLPPPSAAGGGPQLANSRDETSLVPARFSVDLRTNSIIATGSPGDLRIIEALLLRLDQRDIEQRKNTVYRLKNAPADAVARSVNDFLRSEKNVQNAAPGQVSPFQQIESEVVVVPEQVSNSLIISATPRFYDEIEALVEKLDAQPPQVMIQVLIAEVTLNNTNEFGVELGLQDSLLFDRSLIQNLVTTTQTIQASSPSGILTSTTQNILGANNTPGFAWNGAPLGNSGAPSSLATAHNVAGQAVSNFGVGSVNQQLGYGGLVLSASSESVSVLIRALQQSNRLEILSRPQIRTLDNQPAFIQIGQRVPRIVTASVTQVGSVNGVVLENVGLILGVTPRISPEGMVVMEVDAEKSEVDAVNPGIPVSISSNGAVIRSPIFNITTASTTVSANSGETIIIGGLITKSSNETARRVPILSDIPVVGNFFRYDSSLQKRSELLIILTPYVIRTPEESAKIKREEVAKMHWCAGDVIDIYGTGVVSDDPGPFNESDIPVIYPDVNPRGTIMPLELPPEPSAETPALDVDGPPVNVKTTKKDKPKKTGFFPLVSQKKRP